MRLKVKQTAEKTCFISLPSYVADELLSRHADALQAGAIEASWKADGGEAKSVLLSWAGGSCASHEDMEVPSALAQSLGMPSSLIVDVRLKKGVPSASRVDIEPLSPDDWEVLELHAGHVEEQLLNQARVVSTSCILPVWIMLSSLIRFNVTSCHSSSGPCTSVLLAPSTEVVVAPKQRAPNTPAPAPAVTSSPHKIFLRVLPAEWLHPSKSPSHQSLSNPRGDSRCVYVSSAVFQDMGLPPQGAVCILSSPKKGSSLATVLVKEHEQAYPGSVIHVPLCLRAQCGLPACSRGVVSKILGAPPLAKALTVEKVCLGGGERRVRERGQDDDVASMVREWMADWAPVSRRSAVLAEGSILCLRGPSMCGFCSGGGKEGCSGVHARLSFREKEKNDAEKGEVGGGEDGSIEAWSLDYTSLPTEIGVELSESPPNFRFGHGEEELMHGPSLDEIGGLGDQKERLVKELVCLIEGAPSREANCLPFPGGILVHGTAGCGKTLFVKAVVHHVRRLPGCACHVEVVSCSGSRLDGASVNMNEGEATPLGKVEEAIKRAAKMSPSILVIDDLDALAPAQDAQQREADSGRGSATSALLVDSLRRLRKAAGQSPAGGKAPCVAVIATSRGEETLDESLLKTRLFDSFYEIGPPDQETRVGILKAILLSGQIPLSPGFALNARKLGLDGFKGDDMHMLARRTQLHAASRFLKQGQPPLVLSDDVHAALEGFVPATLRSVKKEVGASWEDIGGLEEAKSQLLEAIELPVRFPEIYAKAPLRVKSGALVYGPPGSGKTMVVGALAARCGLNFISVKGPEILNKYIGASEQGVRDVFARASAAKPCLVFFDEFDSVAPHRGNDSTGVTDRVVNQLLTALDGVEGLEGVFVVAATSRPDMIDRALLRPGRLDMHVYLAMSTESERVDILSKLLLKMGASPDIDVAPLAARTQGFSGADLQALMYNAQLHVAHDALDQIEARPPNDGEEVVKVAGGVNAAAQPALTMRDIEKAMTETRASLSDKERVRLENIYAEFGPREPAGDGAEEVGKWRKAAGRKATLA